MLGMKRSAWTSLVADALFPLQERLKRHSTVAMRRALEQSQWWPRQRIETMQLERLRILIEHAQRHVPYFRARFGHAGFSALDLRALDDLARLPLLTKADIRANIESMKSDRAVRLVRSNTGGSSGQPLTFYLGVERISADVAAKWRATRWWGVDIGDPEMVIWGSPIELGTQDRFRSLRDLLFRTTLISAFDLSADRLSEIVARIRSEKPAMLFGYPSAISMIARHAERSGISLANGGIKVVFVTAERLYPDQREIIARVFACPVANGYGGRDAGFIAHECPSGGMHITAEDVIVEILDAAGQPVAPGMSGEIVITHLASRDFPLIRYRTGDVGELDDRNCACGRGLPMLREVHGRTTDFVVAADGTAMHGLSVIYVLRELDGIEQFKIIQETRDRTRVLVVPGEGYGPSIASQIEQGLRRRLGERVQVDIELVQRIDPERSGKHRYVVSHVGVT